MYTTSDLWLAATLDYEGFTVESIDGTNPHRCLFVFEDTPKVEYVVTMYHEKKLSVEPYSFMTRVRQLKNRVFNLKKDMT